MKRAVAILLFSWLFLGLISCGTAADSLHQGEQATPTATPTPILVVTNFSIFPKSVVAGDPFQVTVGLENTYASSVGYLSATITDINNDADLKSAVGSKIFLLPTLASAERRLFTFDFTYEMGIGGARELSLVLDFVYLVDNQEVIGSQRAFVQLSVQEPTPTATATITPAVTQTPSPTATPIPIPTNTPSPQFTVSSTLGVNIRSGPGEAYSVIGGGALNQSFSVVGRNVDSTWWQIEFMGDTGWIWHQLGTVTNPDGVKLVENIPTPPPPTPPPSPLPTAETPPPPSASVTPSDGIIWGEVGVEDPNSPGTQRDALVVEFDGIPMSVAPDTTFPITVTVYNVGPVTITEAVVTWSEQNLEIIPVGAGTTWFLNSIPLGGKQIVSAQQLYVNKDATSGLQRIEVAVDYTGAKDSVYGTAYFLVKQVELESFWLRLLRALSGRSHPKAQP